MSLTKEERELFEKFKAELNKPVTVSVEICSDGIELPEYAKPGDAGMDVRAAEEVIIKPGETKIIPTGIKVALPDGYELQVRPRSGLSLKHPLRIANAPGTIDSGYRDEVGIIMTNTLPESNWEKYDEEVGICGYKNCELDHEEPFLPGVYQINKGDRIAQLVLARVETIDFQQVDDVKVRGLGRGGGFGSTGTSWIKNILIAPLISILIQI